MNGLDQETAAISVALVVVLVALQSLVTMGAFGLISWRMWHSQKDLFSTLDRSYREFRQELRDGYRDLQQELRDRQREHFVATEHRLLVLEEQIVPTLSALGHATDDQSPTP